MAKSAIKVPPVGGVIVDGGQRYMLLRAEPHIRKDGSSTKILVWRSRCAQCGDLFEMRTPRSVRWLNRRCADHKRPGVRVQAR